MRHFKSLCLKQFLLQVFPSPVERFFAILSLVSVFKFISLAYWCRRSITSN
ncbi:hypothetical protein PPHE_a0967 [Pseudoalteromonas phenolica O-BC30]|nr:hypothetical protein [Pseudoalteromonas phenolica O-BC30]